MAIFPNKVFSRPQKLLLLMFKQSQNGGTGSYPDDKKDGSLLEFELPSFSLETGGYPLSSSKTLCWTCADLHALPDFLHKLLSATNVEDCIHSDCSSFPGPTVLPHSFAETPSESLTPWLWVGPCDLFNRVTQKCQGANAKAFCVPTCPPVPL